MRRFDGRVCIVTASASGIGLAIAERLAQEGGKVVISSRSQEHVDHAVADLRAKKLEVSGFVCHVGNAEHRAALIQFAVSTYGGLDILVNNAAISTNVGPTSEVPELHFNKMFDVNVKAAFMLTQAAMPHLLVSKKASILFVASTAAYDPGNVIGIYGVTKTALLGLIKSLASELGCKGIRVNGIAPAVIRTRFSEIIQMAPQATDNALGRIGEPAECAGAAAFLLSEDASFITGETIKLTGGASYGL
jgi:dehydrogenase/reductase SDR family protein 4